jgi:hypothetical protein
MAPVISRIHLTDDTGQGEDGTILDDALFQTLQDHIDGLSGAIVAGAPVAPAPGQIAFPATQNPSANPNVLDDYEEGTYTPTDQSGAGLVFTTVLGNYTKIGRLVTVGAQVLFPTTTDTKTPTISLPFVSYSGGNIYGGVPAFTTAGSPYTILLIAGTATVQLFDYSGSGKQNVNFSGRYVSFSLTYPAAA